TVFSNSFYFTARRAARLALFPYTTLFRSADLVAPARLHVLATEDEALFLAPLGLDGAELGAQDAHGGLAVLELRALRLAGDHDRSEEHTSELQSRSELVCRLLLEK